MDPKSFTSVIDYHVLMGVPIFSEGARRGGEEVWEEVS